VDQDQNAVGDGNLRATVILRAGNQYNFINNRWTWGIQYLTVQTDLPGSRAFIGNTLRDSSWYGQLSFQSGRSPFACNSATGEFIGDCAKNNAYEIDSTTIGSNKITLQNPADAANLKPGRYHLVGSYDDQMGGFPRISAFSSTSKSPR
jgi:hypothetical protein